MFLTRLTSFFMVILYALTSAFSFIPRSIWYGDKTYSVTDRERILLDAAFISDTHSSSEYFNERSRLLRKALCGISQTDYLPDTLVIAGDISNASDPKEYSMLRWSMETFNKVKSVLPAAGNHDVRAAGTFEEAAGYFCDFAKLCGIETDKTYYSTYINDYKFIILGSEDMLSLEAHISDTQLQWFDSQMAEAVTTNKPVFVVCHQPLYNSNNTTFNPNSEKNWGIGAQNEQITGIFRKYVPSYDYPVFFITGHLHRSYNEYSFDTDYCENLYCVNIPSVTKTESGGLGLTVEVYSDEVLLRARNYITMEWLESYQYKIQFNAAEDNQGT